MKPPFLLIVFCHFFVVIFLYEGTQRFYVFVDGIENLFLLDFVIPMNQNLTYICYIFLWNFWMRSSEFFSQHI